MREKSRIRGVRFGFALFAVVLLGAGAARAQMLANPARNAGAGKFEAGGAFGSWTADYESDLFYEDASIERQGIGGYAALGVAKQADLFVAGAFLFNSENDKDTGDGGNGFLGAAGVRGKLMQKEDMSLRAYGQVRYINEDYGEYRLLTVTGGTTSRGMVETKGTFLELIAGLLATYDMDDLRLYGGVEVVPFEDSDIDKPTKNEKQDIERSDIVAARLGVQYAPAAWWLRLDVGVMGEEGVTLEAGRSF